MFEPFIRRVTHSVVHVPNLKLAQLSSTLRYGDGEEDCLSVRSAIYPEYVEGDGGWFYLCATAMRHTTIMLDCLCYGGVK